MRRLPLALLSLLLPLLAACGGAGLPDPGPAGPDPTAFKTLVEHPFLPLLPGRVWVYEGLDEGRLRREAVRAQEEPREVLGIACTALTMEVALDGEVVEITTEWFAQDRDGNVWKFGEETLEFSGGAFGLSEDSWTAGADGAVPWMFLAALPQPGDRYVGDRPNGHEETLVLSVDETAVVPAGIFGGCLQVEETTEDVEDADVVLYAPAVGRVAEQGTGGSIELVEVR